MTYAQSLMVIRNPNSGYSALVLRAAALDVMANLYASEEDMMSAAIILGWTKGSAA